jgi:hypothetical protein
MTTVTTQACDVCGRLKQQVNHWLRITVSDTEGIVIVPAIDGKKSYFHGLAIEDICGAECAQKRLSQWLTEQGI